MIDNHPITPPPELVQQWRKSAPADAAANNAYERHIATQAARWGADQELEACCEWLRCQNLVTHCALIPSLRAARRPKPLSLKKLALEILEYPKDFWSEDEVDTIRRALETLDD